MNRLHPVKVRDSRLPPLRLKIRTELTFITSVRSFLSKNEITSDFLRCAVVPSMALDCINLRHVAMPHPTDWTLSEARIFTVLALVESITVFIFKRPLSFSL
jgi:hypothetical protein